MIYILKSLKEDFLFDLFQYTEWPEKSKPDEAETLISLIERVNREYNSSNWPILVLCK